MFSNFKELDKALAEADKVLEDIKHINEFKK
jgi:hypothetical protein